MYLIHCVKFSTWKVWNLNQYSSKATCPKFPARLGRKNGWAISNCLLILTVIVLCMDSLINSFYLFCIQMCSTAELSDKNEFPTFGRTFPVDSRIGSSIISLLKNTYKWTRIAIIYQNVTRWTSLTEHLQEEFEKNGITVAMKFETVNVPIYNLEAEEEFKKALIKIKQTARSKYLTSW